MIDKFGNEDGFSLLEVVISLGIMSILSVFILHMFVAGSRVNVRAADMDRAALHAVNALEELGAALDPNAFLDTDFIVGTQIAFGLSAFFVLEERQALTAFDFSGGMRLYKYFDENWQTVAAEEVYEEPYLMENEEVAFILRLHMTPYIQEYDEAVGVDLVGLFSVDVEVRDVGSERLLVDISTKAYFPQTGEMYGIYDQAFVEMFLP